MNCIRPGSVSPDDLIALVAGEASESVVDHVRACPRCAADAREYARAERGLRQVLDRFDCPSSQRLGEYELGLVTADDRWSIAAHLVDCRRCADEVRSFHGFLADEPVPAQSLADRARRVVRAILAPSPGLAYGGLRGTSTTSSRSFRAEDITITLGPGPELRHGRVSVAGLLVQDDGEADLFGGGEVRLVPSNGPTLVATVDDMSNFLFEDLVPGTYGLELDLPDRLIVVDELYLDE